MNPLQWTRLEVVQEEAERLSGPRSHRDLQGKARNEPLGEFSEAERCDIMVL